jgi:myo-inositol-1(or 4)-monophosphatase
VPLDPLLVATAVDAVLEAGDVQMAYFGQTLHIGKKGAIDLVTDVDVEVERRFRAMIAERFPEHAILAEEQGGAGDVPPGYCWVFDPVDGTTNFAHGLPIFCASLGVEYDGEAVYAAVYDPTRRELFTAEKGLGAFLNGVPLRVSTETRLPDAMLCTGFPYDVHTQGADVLALFGEFVGRARAVRRLGSAALDLCYVAAGRLDGFWEQRLKPWDTCAGALIVAEAGGRVTRWSGGPFQSRHDDLLATNGQVHAQMFEVIAGFLARAGKRTST